MGFEAYIFRAVVVAYNSAGHTMVQPFVQQVQDMTSAFKPEPWSLAPKEKADWEFSISGVEYQHVGQLTTHPVYHDKCHAEGPGLHAYSNDRRGSHSYSVQTGRERVYQCLS